MTERAMTSWKITLTVKIIVFGITAWCCVVPVLGQQNSVTPDAVYFDGKIITVDSRFSVQEAFAVTGDRFSAVGTKVQVRALAGSQTRLVDLRGRAVIPGLMDNHNHAYHAALAALRGVDLGSVKSLAEMLTRIQRAAAAAPPGRALYINRGWDPTGFPEKRPPTRQELDQAAPDRPVVVYLARGLAHLNSQAFKSLGITRDQAIIRGAVIQKDSSGEPTGAISGVPFVEELTQELSPLTLQEKKNLILEIQKLELPLGLTSIRELQVTPDIMRAYYELWREGRLTMRVSVGLELNAPDADHVEELLKNWGVGPGFGDHWLRLDGIAEFNPGNVWREPLGESAGNLRLPLEKFRKAIQVINQYGWRPAIHIYADKTLDLVLDAYEAADRESSIRDKRWIVEHIPVVHPDQMERIKKLGVLVSAQIQPYTEAASMVQQWGRQRAERAVPMRELLDHGLLVSGGSDWPPSSSFHGPTNNPFVNIYYYVTRNTLEAGPLGIAQKISREEALRVESINNAYLTYEEKIKGSIEPGKLADFLILSDDILTIPEDRIRFTRPLATFVGGRKAYSTSEEGF